MLDVLKKQYKVSDYRLDMVQQTQGIDFGIIQDGWRREFTLDVKNNLYITPEFYAFKIELESDMKAGWFFTSKADRIYHTNAYMGQYIYYDLNQLRYFVTKRIIDNDYSAFTLVKHNGDLLLQFKFEPGVDHHVPISVLFK